MAKQCSFRMKRPDREEPEGCQFERDGQLVFNIRGEIEYEFCQFHAPFDETIHTINHSQKIISKYLDSNNPIPPKSKWDKTKIDGFNNELVEYIANWVAINKKNKNSTNIPAQLDLSGVVFPGDIDFSEIFKNLKIKELRYIFICQAAFFGGKAIFEDITFQAEARFDFCVFNESANFDRTTFEGLAKFGGARFTSIMSFMDADFFVESIFSSATLTGESPIKWTPS